MGSAALVFAMGRFLGPWTLGLVTACLIVLVNSNIDHNLKEIGQDDGLFRGLLDINPNELRWKRAAQGVKKSKGLQKKKKSKTRTNTVAKGGKKSNGGGKSPKTKKSQTRTNKVAQGGKKNNGGVKSPKKRSNKNGKQQSIGKRKGNNAKKKKNGGGKFKGNKKNEKKAKGDNKKQKKNKGRGKKKKKCTKKNGCKGKKTKPTKAPKIDSKQTCPADQADATCLLNAIESLVYEQKQLTNFLKQAKLLENHERVSGNKGAKSDVFHHAADHALWAIGGNVSDPKCGPNSTDSAKYNSSVYDYEKALALESYETLSQCEVNITFFCNTSNIDGYDAAFWAAKIETCRALVDNYQTTSKRCQDATDNVREQCDCWAEQVENIAEIKAEGCNIKAAQRNVTEFKEICLDTFTSCKKKEDKSVESVYYCMDDHSMVFINQTAQSLALAAEKDVARKSPRSWHLHNLLIDLAS